MLRSVPMAYCQIYMQPAIAFETMAKLGELNCVHFLDTHTDVASNTRNYTAEICRCAELERKLQYIESQMLQEGKRVKILDPENDPKPIHPSEMIMFENMIEKWENNIFEISENVVDLKLDLLELKEINGILKHIGPMLDASKEEIVKLKAKFQDNVGDACCPQPLYILSGVLERDKSMQCQQMLWRLSHGNIYFRQTDKDIILDVPCRGEVRKVAFIAACQGEQLRNRLEKVCTAFKAKIYPCPTDQEERAQLQKRIDERINDIDTVLGKSRYYRLMTLRSAAKQWRGWLIQVRKTKAIYHQINLMTLDNPKNCLIGNCWVRERDIPKVQIEMNKSMRLLGVRAPSVIIKAPYPEKVVLPTVQHTNKFTRAPQALIDTYGVAKYREINPGVFTIVGLPFLFGLMFSDMGHAVILIGIALWLIIQEEDYKKRRGNEIWDLFFGGRYMFLMMGIWSAVAGFCYNQLFSRSINLGNSMYKNVLPVGPLGASSTMFMGGNSRLNIPYIWGMDPVWQISKNKIIIKNSLMMKMSIIIGTIHMLFGLIISIFNFRYFKDYYAIFLQFLPKFLFISCIFGWTVGLIYYKWYAYYEGHSDIKKTGFCAPDLTSLFLTRFIPMTIEYDSRCNVLLFDAQRMTEILLNIFMILSILLLLFGTPLYIYIYNARTTRYIQKEMRYYRYTHMKACKLSCSNPCGTYCEDACGKQEEKWRMLIDQHSTPLSELLSNQIIITLDFVLGVVAHVASYLRIWALSLGHYLLSETLWVMVLRTMGLRILEKELSTLQIVVLVLAFALFAILTIIILVMMEGLCCFLHALRLHWVEFMSKFYVDEGSAFQPFNFKNIFSKELDRVQEVCPTSKHSSRKRKECLY